MRALWRYIRRPVKMVGQVIGWIQSVIQPQQIHFTAGTLSEEVDGRKGERQIEMEYNDGGVYMCVCLPCVRVCEGDGG